MGHFDTDYIIFRNVDNSEKNILKENKEFDKIFENISFTEMKSSNLINYPTNVCQIDQGTMVLVMAHRKKMSRYDKSHNIHGLCELDELSLKGSFFSRCVL
jgi:hypothetical protein